MVGERRRAAARVADGAGAGPQVRDAGGGVAAAEGRAGQVLHHGRQVVADVAHRRGHRARAIEDDVHVERLQAAREVEIVLGRALRRLVRLDEHEVAVGLRVVGGVVGVGAGGLLDEVAHAVVVGVAVARVGLAAVAHAVAVGVLGAVGEAVVVAVAIVEVGAGVAVGVARRAAAGLELIAAAVGVGVEVAPVAGAIAVVVDDAVVEIEDGVVVRVGVGEVGRAVAVGVDRVAGVGADLDEVRDVVAVVVGIREVGATIAVGVAGAIDAVGATVVVGVGVAEVGGAVAVRVVGRRGGVGVAGLAVVVDAVAVGVAVLVVGRAVSVGVDAGGDAFVGVGDAVAVGVAGSGRQGVVTGTAAREQRGGQDGREEEAELHGSPERGARRRARLDQLIMIRATVARCSWRAMRSRARRITSGSQVGYVVPAALGTADRGQQSSAGAAPRDASSERARERTKVHAHDVLPWCLPTVVRADRGRRSAGLHRRPS